MPEEHEECLLIKQPKRIVRRTNRRKNSVPGVVIVVHVLDAHHPVSGEDRGVKVVYQSVGIEISLGPGGGGLLLPVESKRRFWNGSARGGNLDGDEGV